MGSLTRKRYRRWAKKVAKQNRREVKKPGEKHHHLESVSETIKHLMDNFKKRRVIQ